MDPEIFSRHIFAGKHQRLVPLQHLPRVGLDRAVYDLPEHRRRLRLLAQETAPAEPLLGRVGACKHGNVADHGGYLQAVAVAVFPLAPDTP